MSLTSAQPRTARTRRLLVFATLGAFALRAVALGSQSLWRDEIDAIWFALRPLNETLSMFTAMAQNGPLYFLALRPWLQTVGSSELALRLPSAFAGAAAVPLIWQVARLLLGARSGSAPLLAAILYAINPYALWYGREGKMYALVTLLALAATWYWLRGVERGGWRPWVAYALAVTLAIYVHLLAVLIIPLHMLWFVIAWPQARRRWRGYFAALATLTLPYLPLLAWQWPMLLRSDPITGFRDPPLSEMAKTILINQARGFMPNDSLLLLAPVWIAGAIGLTLGIMELPRAENASGARLPLGPLRRYLLLVSWLVAPVLFIWLLSLRQPVFTDRYVLWTLPAAMMLVALGIQVVRRRLGHLGLPAALLLALWIAALWLFSGWQQTTTTIKYDLRSAVRYINERRDPATLLILQIPHMEWAWRYYSADQSLIQSSNPFEGSDARLGNWAGGLWTNGGADDTTAIAQVDAEMRALTTGSSELWLLLSEPDMWDSRRLMDQWLAANADLVEEARFHGSQVARYELRNQ